MILLLMRFLPLLPDHFHQHAIRSATIEFAVEDLLPRAEVEFAIGDGDQNLSDMQRMFIATSFMFRRQDTHVRAVFVSSSQLTQNYQHPVDF